MRSTQSPPYFVLSLRLALDEERRVLKTIPSHKKDIMEMDDFEIVKIEPDEIDRLIAELNQFYTTGPECLAFHIGNERNNDNLGISSMYEEILQMERDENYASLLPETQQARKPESNTLVSTTNDQTFGGGAGENPSFQLMNPWYMVEEPENGQLSATGPIDFQQLLPIAASQPGVALNNIDQRVQNEAISESTSSSSARSDRTKKSTVPDEDKTEKYWEKRYKNTEATKRSRKVKKVKIGRIMTTKKCKEQELADLRMSYEEFKKKCSELEKSNLSLEETLSKVSELCKIGDAFSELRAMEE